MIGREDMNKIGDDISNAYRDGYEQGRFDGVMDATNGLAACRGYEVIAVVKCKNCIHFDTNWTYCGGDVHYCGRHRIARREEEFCSDGEVKE
jgi:hypothetical protein